MDWANLEAFSARLKKGDIKAGFQTGVPWETTGAALMSLHALRQRVSDGITSRETTGTVAMKGVHV